MTEKQNGDVISLRAHHIICMRFRSSAFDERGPGFTQVKDKIKARLAQPDALIMVAEGIDILCHECPNLGDDGRCTAARGDETEVRKWDAILLRELGIPFGSCLTAGEWQAAINKKIPFKLCLRCQWKKVCTTGDLII
ncbi:MAG: DUF1284 domain-containing protein [Dehalococcoidales bacterium]|nr:DUF1284 domain-containing protein [Dehalococcoidales bacterium]